MYRKIGLNERPLAAWLIGIADQIRAAGGGAGWEPRVVGALISTNGIPPGKFLTQVHPEEVIALPGNTMFPPNSQGMRALQHLVFILLHAAGIRKQQPAVLEYSENPDLTIDEACDRMLSHNIILPQLDDYGGTNARWASFAHVVPLVIRQILQVNNERPILVDRLRIKVADIGYKILMGRPITTSERSLFLALAPGGERARTQVERAAGTLPPVIHCAANHDIRVNETFSLYEKSVEHGPFSRFISLSSDTDGRRLAFYLGPAPTSLPVSVGWIMARGHFSQFDFTQVFDIPWNKESVLMAVHERETQVFGHDMQDPFVLVPPVQSSLNSAFGVYTSVDEPDFELFFADETTGPNQTAPNVASFEVRYHCKMTNRVQATAFGTFPGPLMLVYDRAYGNIAFGGNEISTAQLTDFKLIAPDECVGCNFSGMADPTLETGPVLTTLAYTSEAIYFPNPALGIVEGYIVPMSTHLYRRGRLMLCPGMRDYVMLSKSQMYSEDAGSVSYILAQLGFSEAEKRLVHRSVLISHNVAMYGSVLPAAAMPNVDPVRVALSEL